MTWGEEVLRLGGKLKLGRAAAGEREGGGRGGGGAEDAGAGWKRRKGSGGIVGHGEAWGGKGTVEGCERERGVFQSSSNHNTTP